MPPPTNDPNPSVDVALVSMPWAPVHEPSLGLAILKACLHEAGFSCRVFHFSATLLKYISAETYQVISNTWATSESLFTGEIDDSARDDTQREILSSLCERYARERRSERYRTAAEFERMFLGIRDRVVPQYLAECRDAVAAVSPKIVGMTCMFDQTMASAALAKKLKEHDPGLPIVLGGYALEGEPGQTVARAFDFIDRIVVGDGEKAIVELARAAVDRGELPMGPRPAIDTRYGVIPLVESSRRTDGARPSNGSGRVMRGASMPIEQVPVPDYDDWFADLALLERDCDVRVSTRVLPLEASRGCWWGQKKHCVFCGIDEDSLKYRSKTAEATLHTLHTLRARYGDDMVYRFSDYIMPKQYYKDLLPRLAAEPKPFVLEGEIKANQTPERVALLARAGFAAVQPGIESFSTPVLKLMDKGVRSIDNVMLLRAAYENRIVLYYNLLYGLPGEEASFYDDQLGRIPLVYHLTPPISRTEIVVTRHAPLQAEPARFGLSTKPVHDSSYGTLFAEEFNRDAGFDLDEYAYYFERNFDYSPPLADRYHATETQVDIWKAQHLERFVELSFREVRGRVEIIDGRTRQVSRYTLSPAASALYLVVQPEIVPLRRAVARLLRTTDLTEGDLDSAARELERRRLVWQEGDLWLGLAVDKKISDYNRSSNWKDWWMSLSTRAVPSAKAHSVAETA